jgi:hypothetical protein
VAYNILSQKIKVFIYEIESIASQLVEMRLSVDRSMAQTSAQHKSQKMPV